MKKCLIVIGVSLLVCGLIGCGAGANQHIQPIELKPEAIPQEIIEEIGTPTSETIPEGNGTADAETMPEGNGATAPESLTEDPEAAFKEEQLQILAEHKDLWAGEPGFADESYQYAVTDLDSNGRYEMIVSGMGGTGMYTYSRFFRVKEDGSGLEECITDFQEGDSQPDLMAGVWDAYLDGKGVLHYAVNDLLKNGAAEYYENIRGLVLQENKIVTETIAFRSTIYETEDPFVVCQDASGNMITEADYEKAAATYFAGCEKKQVRLGWQNVRELPEDLDGVVEKLRASAAVWSVSE